MNNKKKSFGYYLADKKTQKKISFCRKLSNNWINKQTAQLIRKHVIKHAPLPLDLNLDGIKLRCFLTDNICERNFVFMPWRYDVLERQEMLSCLPTDGVFIDIGANIGIYSTIAARHLSATGRVVCIEPNPPVFERLTFNLNATTSGCDDSPTIEALMLGISDSSCEFDLFLDSKNLGASSLLASDNKTKCIKIPCEPLLDIVEQLKLSQVDVIKCDIEGAEDKALIPFLKQADVKLLPKCIIFENNTQQWSDDLHSALCSKGYQLFAKTRLNFIYKHY